MALLNRFRMSSGAKFASLLLLGGALAGCVIFDSMSPAGKRFAFSHKVHVVDQGLECGSCHAQPEGARLPGLPSQKACMLCHEDLDATKPDDRKVASLYVDKQFRAAHVGALGDEVVFPHARHAAEGVLECAQCHTGIDENEDVLELASLSMANCTSCHSERKLANECSTCHSQLGTDVRPRSHDLNWVRRHGANVCAKSGTSADTCSLCHQESTCVSCHMEMPPVSHTNHWRLRGHGITASLDRESCATCHRSDSCSACHSETKPMNHTGAWGDPTDRHCTSCHFPLQNEGCSTCHRGTPSHDLATPLPPDHSAGMNCRMCHGNGQPLPHVDNGDSCSYCHR